MSFSWLALPERKGIGLQTRLRDDELEKVLAIASRVFDDFVETISRDGDVASAIFEMHIGARIGFFERLAVTEHLHIYRLQVRRTCNYIDALRFIPILDTIRAPA